MNGDLWLTPDNQKGLEMGRTEKFLKLSIIKPDWPFPNAPVLYKKWQCKRILNRYNKGIADAEESPL